MIVLVALVCAIALALVLWRVGSSAHQSPQRRLPGRSQNRSPNRSSNRSQPPRVAPDDDPDFLREISRRARKDDETN